jgi:hypothetical protein
MANFAKTLIDLVVDRSARPDWTLAAIASLLAAGIVASFDMHSDNSLRFFPL